MSHHNPPVTVPDIGDRHDLYGPIHKGLRKAQCELLVRLGSADFACHRTSGELLAETRGFLEIARAHIEHEQHHIHTALRGAAVDHAARLDDQHDHHRADFDALERLIADVEAADGAGRAAAGRRLYLSFSAHVARDLLHMFEEETEAAPQLWGLLPNAELVAIEGRIVGALPPEKAMAFIRMVVPAVNPAERVAMLDDMRQGAPREAFDAVMEFTVRPNLSAAEFADLGQRLGLAA
jgi:hypothetical protein